jgi:hypothetical protein
MIPDPVPSTGGSSSATSSAASSPATRADFDQRLANDLSAAASLINNALSKPEVLAELSYTQVEIEEGKALHTAAQAAFNARQQAVGTASTAATTRDDALEIVREDFTDYRATVQANFSPDVRTALGAGGRVPADLQKFITFTRSAYAAAQQPPYAAVLAKRKLTATVLTARVGKVDELEVLDGKAKAADKGSTAATQARDKAGATLAKWVAAFRKQAKTDLRKFPALRAELGL